MKRTIAAIALIIALALTLAAQLRRCGYSVDIWECTANGSRQIH